MYIYIYIYRERERERERNEYKMSGVRMLREGIGVFLIRATLRRLKALLRQQGDDIERL